VGEMLVVYAPTSPNPISGFTLVLHNSKVIKSKLDIEAVTSFLVSRKFCLLIKEGPQASPPNLIATEKYLAIVKN
jgi:uncharacterized membrane protein